MSKKQNIERNLHVDLTRSLTHAIKNRFSQEDTHIIEKVFFVVINDSSNEYTRNHVQSRSEVEEYTTSRNDKDHRDTDLR